MIARPGWLSDEMLAEMRRLEGSSDNAPFPDSAHSGLLYRMSSDIDDDWLDGYGPRHSKHPNTSWLTPAGHKALAAIEAESEFRPVPPPSDYVGEGITPAPLGGSISCTYCDHGGGPSGIGMLGGRCPRCNGSKVET